MKDSKNLSDWLNDFNLKRPFIIAGPCSAETENQVLTIAHQLKNTDTNVMRAGIWKPRTRPGNFEGVGALGLKWLQKAKKETGLLMATEVANPVHVELALKHDIDILWIGARTTVSPFNVEEISEALRGTDKIVLIKNPVNPDLALWLGAVERFYEKDVRKLGVVHRGFSSYKESVYRNIPEWQIPIDLQNDFPHLPLFIDPSHIAGNRQLIFELSQTALNLNYDGLMIETHPTPDEAWSDAKQQITAERLNEIINNLKIPKKKSADKEFQNTLSSLRQNIDLLDQQLIETLVKRMKIADKIGAIKKEQNVAILQSEQWNKVLEQMTDYGIPNGLSLAFIQKIFKAIHQESIDHQNAFFDQE